MTLNSPDADWQLFAGLYIGLLLIWFIWRIRRVKQIRQFAIVAALLICVLFSFFFGNWTIRITTVLLCLYGIIRFAPDETIVIRRGIAGILTRFGAVDLAQRVWSSNDDIATKY